LYCIVLYCIVLYCIVLYCIVLYCIVLYYIVLYCIVLYCIATSYNTVLVYALGHHPILEHSRELCSAASLIGSINKSASVST